MSVANEIATFARTQLTSILELSGNVLYSSADTLRPGHLYLLGHNPGGSPGKKKSRTIGASLDVLPQKTTNDYLDDSWGDCPAGTGRLQLRVKWLLENIGYDPRSVAASNLIFVRSVAVTGSQYADFAELCWSVHVRILEVVAPRLVIVFGNSADSPYSFLARKFKTTPEVTTPSGHGVWACRSFVVPRRFRVVGLPHLSRYKISNHPEVAAWIRSMTRSNDRAKDVHAH